MKTASILMVNVLFATKIKKIMKEPKIDGTPITEIAKYSKNESLVELFHNSDASDEDKQLVQLLPMACAWDFNEADKILSDSFMNDKSLVSYYPSVDKEEPNGKLIGSIMDGSLWLV